MFKDVTAFFMHFLRFDRLGFRPGFCSNWTTDVRCGYVNAQYMFDQAYTFVVSREAEPARPFRPGNPLDREKNMHVSRFDKIDPTITIMI
jgi:hypothetical protein